MFALSVVQLTTDALSAYALWREIIAAAGFDTMKAQGDALISVAHMLWKRGPSRFLNEGTNGR